MATYWHYHPRNFANECTILRAETPEQARRLETEGFSRLTRDQARRHIRRVNGENNAWGSGRAFGALDFAALTKGLDGYNAAEYIALCDQADRDRALESLR